MQNCGCDIEHDSDKDEPYTLRVAEEQPRNVRALDTCLLRNDQQLSISLKNEIHIFLAEADDRAVVHDYVRQESVCLHVRVAHCFLVELEPCHAQATQDHQGRE